MSPRAQPPTDAIVAVRVTERDLALLEQLSAHHHVSIERVLERVVTEFTQQQRTRLRGAASNQARARAASKEQR